MEWRIISQLCNQSFFALCHRLLSFAIILYYRWEYTAFMFSQNGSRSTSLEWRRPNITSDEVFPTLSNVSIHIFNNFFHIIHRATKNPQNIRMVHVYFLYFQQPSHIWSYGRWTRGGCHKRQFDSVNSRHTRQPKSQPSVNRQSITTSDGSTKNTTKGIIVMTITISFSWFW